MSQPISITSISMSQGKRLKKASVLSTDSIIALDKALENIKEYGENFSAKFDETVEVVLKLGVDTRHSDQLVRGIVPMPNGLGGKKKIIAVFTEESNAAINAGADIAGSDELIAEVEQGKISFDICLATPSIMPKLAKLGKILGPKGLMPNPRSNTVGQNVETMIKQIRAGQVEFKADKYGIVHAGVGKVSFEKNKIKENIMALHGAVSAAKPSGSKGIYMQRMYLSTSSGLSWQVDFASL